MKESGIEGWSYFPREAQGLRKAIREAASFSTWGEVSQFASSMVDVVAKLDEQVKNLERSLLSAHNRIVDLECDIMVMQAAEEECH